MSDFLHRDVLHIEWTVSAQNPPRPILAYRKCGGARPYRSSGRIRLNANGKRLDAWLIYKCTGCDGTWNRTIFERQSVRSLEPTAIEAMQASSPDFVARLEFDSDALRALAGRIENPQAGVGKRVIFDAGDWRQIEIALVVPSPTGLRLDRLLAAELGLSRSRLKELFNTAGLTTRPDRKDALRRAVRHGTVITLDLRDEAERLAIGLRARSG